VVALVGDGAFLMTGLELLTAKNLQLGLLAIILRDQELAQISQFQKIALNRKTCTILPQFDIVKIVDGLGINAFSCQKNEDIPFALKKAKDLLEKGQPVVIDCSIDYSQKTYFTKGVVKTNFGRLPWSERLRFLKRAITRKIS